MAVSINGRRLLCILCSVYVQSKMLKLCSAEGSSFRDRVEIHQTLVSEVDLFVGSLVDVVRLCFWGNILEVDPVWLIRVVWCCQIFVSDTTFSILILERLLSDGELAVVRTVCVFMLSFLLQLVVVRRAVSKSTCLMLSEFVSESTSLQSSSDVCVWVGFTCLQRLMFWCHWVL